MNISQAKQLMNQINEIELFLGNCKYSELTKKGAFDYHQFDVKTSELKEFQATLSTTKLWVQDKIEGLKKDIEFLKDVNKHSCCDNETKEFEPCKRCKMVRKQLQAKETELKEVLETEGVLK